MKAIIKLETEPLKLRAEFMDLDTFLLNSTYEIGFDSVRAKIKLDVFGGALKYTEFINTMTNTSQFCYEIDGKEYIIERKLEMADSNELPGFEWTDEYKLIENFLCRKLIIQDEHEGELIIIQAYVTGELKTPYLTLPFSDNLFYQDFGAPLEILLSINEETVYLFTLKSLSYDVDDSYFNLPKDAIIHEKK